MPEIPVVTRKDASIARRNLHPYYMDSRFRRTSGEGTTFKSGTIVLAPGFTVITEEDVDVVEGATYTNSTEWSFGTEIRRRAVAAVGNDDTAAFFESMLREVYQTNDLDLVHIRAGIDGMTLDPYLDFGMVDPTTGDPIVHPQHRRPR